MGQFSWLTHDTETQIGSDIENTITVTMFDNKGNSWTESNYEGYCVFGGKDYYELLAEMNGEKPDREEGIDIAFDKTRSKTLFPALYQNPDFFNINEHDFTHEASIDPNQSWYVDDSYDNYDNYEDDYYEDEEDEDEEDEDD